MSEAALDSGTMIFPGAEPAVAFNIGAATEYVDRGVSLSSGKPVGSGGADADFGEFYVGVWGSTVDFSDFGDDQTDTEINIYAGRRFTAVGVDLDVGYTYSLYGGQAPDAGLDMGEFHILASRTWGAVTLGGMMAYSPDNSGDTGEALYSEVRLARQIGSWAVSGAVGRQQDEAGGDYDTWNAGVTWAPGRFSIEARYSATDGREQGPAYGPRLSLSLGSVF